MKKLTKEDIFEILYYHSNYCEIGELEYSEWAARLIEDYGYTILDFLGKDSDFDECLRRLKRNFPGYDI